MPLYSAVPSNRLVSRLAWAAAIASWFIYLLVLWLAWQAAMAAGIDGALEDDAPAPTGLLVQEIRAGSPAEAAGLRPGDHIVAIDGVPFTETDAFRGALEQIRPDRSVTYSVLPGGTDNPVSVTDLSVRPLPLLDDPFLLMMFGVFTIAGALTLLIATIILLVRPGLEAARVLFVVGLCAAFMLGLALWYDSNANLAVGWAHYLLSAATSAALLHLFLVFPTRHAWLARISPSGQLTRGRNAVSFAGLYGFAVVAAVAIGAPGQVLERIYVLDAAIIGVGLVLLIASYRRPTTPLARAQLRWIVWAFALLVLTLLVSVVAPLIAFGRYPFVSVGLVTLVWCAFPLSIAFAVLHYRLFDVDAVLRATVVYGVLGAALVVAYVALAFVLGRLVASLAGPIAGNDPTVSLVAALAVAALAHPLRLRVQDALDRLVYRHQVARRRFGAEASEWLARARPLESVANLLTQQAPARLGLFGAGLVLASGMERLAEPSNTLPGPLPDVPGGLADYLAQLGGPAIVADVEQWPGDVAVVSPEDPMVQPWYRAGARVLVPLGSGDYDRGSEQRLVGVWALGDRMSHDLFDRDDLRAVDRIGQQAAVLLDYLRLGREQAQQEVTRRELERARAIQQRLLPSSLLGWPGQLDLAARLRPAFETSGDFYDVFAVGSADSPPALQLAVADVAGKGIGAALVMALTRATLRASSDAADAVSDGSISYSPAAILRRTGTRLHADVGVSNFVACTLAAFECRSGAPRLRLANAGQVFPLLYRRGQILELDPGGDRLPLGVADRPAYIEMEVELLPGDVLVFATDGLAEAPRYGHHRGEVFGFERLAASTVRLAQSAGSAAEIVDGIWNEMTRWIGGDAEHDDVTLLVARIPRGEGSGTT